jgi:hypothetical protein
VTIVEADLPAVTFAALISDSLGKPIVGARVNFLARTAGHLFEFTEQDSGPDGVARLTMPARELHAILNATVNDVHIVGWQAFFQPIGNTNGVIYCDTRGDGDVPVDVANLVAKSLFGGR